jgi:hypothetical protein
MIGMHKSQNKAMNVVNVRYFAKALDGKEW